MDQNARAQVRLIIDHLSDLSRASFDQRLKAIYASHAARHLLQSGSTVKVAISAMEEISGKLIDGMIDKVSAVAQNVEAFAMIYGAFETYAVFLKGKVDGIAGMATGNRHRIQRTDSVLRAAETLFDEMLIRLRRQLEIHRFTFTQPAPRKFSPTLRAADEPQPPTKQNPGGKPRAGHWEEMWAAMATLLYVGDLKPKTQADVARAMKDWIAARNIDVGDTAINERARQLWRKLQDTE
ncbi:hypothetical protein [Sphingomonas oryzagri]|uniref:Uncharacterized protein n=1 Tax=Sphingomonas oryzagri TaxID=3042314 RepID=A0ABT6N365_9SPHN|nr:hypothetical protein [Sphingomonas oryzagri]MDH7639491.1 hypothetical protein [Sphingomonas oryzagri]